MWRLTLHDPEGRVAWQCEGALGRLIGALVELYWTLTKMERERG